MPSPTLPDDKGDKGSTGAMIADVLNRAADLIEPEGDWQKGGYGPGRLPTCMGGAVMLACGQRVADCTGRAKSIVLWLNDFLGTAVAPWNDAPERTQAEVVAKLREAAAKALEPGK